MNWTNYLVGNKRLKPSAILSNRFPTNNNQITIISYNLISFFNLLEIIPYQHQQLV